MKVCCGGIIGEGETATDRAGLLQQFANMPAHPESVPINNLVKVKGTPLADAQDLDAFDVVRIIAVARIMMPARYERLSAGRQQVSEQTQALCFFAGANPIFCGEKLLPEESQDLAMFLRPGLQPDRQGMPSEQGVSAA